MSAQLLQSSFTVEKTMGKNSCSVRFSVCKFQESEFTRITSAPLISTIKHLSTVFTVQTFHVKKPIYPPKRNRDQWDFVGV